MLTFKQNIIKIFARNKNLEMIFILNLRRVKCFLRCFLNLDSDICYCRLSLL